MIKICLFQKEATELAEMIAKVLKQRLEGLVLKDVDVSKISSFFYA